MENAKRLNGSELGFENGTEKGASVACALSFDEVMESRQISRTFGSGEHRQPLAADSLSQLFGDLHIEKSVQKPENSTPVRFTPDKSRLDEIYDQPHLPFPFMAGYAARDGGKLLDYIASAHSGDRNSPVFKMIETALKNPEIDAVIIEGSSNPVPKDEFLPNAHGNYDGESNYAASLARDRGIPVIGGDVSDAQLYENFHGKPNEYSLEDYLNSTFRGMLIQSNLLHEFDGKNEQQKDLFLKEKYQGYVKNILNELQHFGGKPVSDDYYALTKQLQQGGKNLDYDEFKNWYQKMTNQTGSFDLAQAADHTMFGPRTDGAPLQKMAAVQNQFRNETMVKAIADAMNQYHHVLVIYGGSHFVQQQRVLQDMLGTPRLTNI